MGIVLLTFVNKNTEKQKREKKSRDSETLEPSVICHKVQNHAKKKKTSSA